MTVSLVVYNGTHWLPGCIASVERQTLKDFELLVIDNASSDGSREWLHEMSHGRAWMSVEALDANLGFAAAQNRNIVRAQGEFVCLLNQDVELDERFLELAVAAFSDRPRVAAVQGRLLSLLPDGTRSTILDSTGLVMRRSRRVVSRGQGLPDGPEHSVAGQVWGADGPAPVYRATALTDAREPRTGGGWEVLDEDFFMYKEDVDLAWRLRRLGWQAWYQPTAVAWHARTAGVGSDSSPLALMRRNWFIAPWIRALSWRNQRLMQIKNESRSSFLADLVPIFARELASVLFVVMLDPWRLAALGSVRTLVSAALAKRRYLLGRRATVR